MDTYNNEKAQSSTTEKAKSLLKKFFKPQEQTSEAFRDNVPQDIQVAWSNKGEDVQADNLIIEGHTGTWFVFASQVINDIEYVLLENEDYGDNAYGVIVDGDGKVVLDGVTNGFADLEWHLGRSRASEPQVYVRSDSEHLEFHNRPGEWCVVGCKTLNAKEYFLLRREDLNDDEPKMIVTANGEIIGDNVANGFAELEWALGSSNSKSVADNSKNIVVEGHSGTWFVFASQVINDIEYVLLESEDYGDNAYGVIVDGNGKIVLEDVRNGLDGFDDLDNYLESKPTIIQAESLAGGWKWHDFQDGSGHLESPQGESYFSYDLSTNEVKSAKGDEWVKYDGNIKALKISREQWINENIITVTKFRLFVDMDGTLAVFKPVDTLETLYEPGYFVNLEPQQKVIDAVKLIIAENLNVEVNILSAYLTDSKFALQEKNDWVDKYLPEIDAAHRVFVPCGEDKKLFISNLKQTDFLLDDYTKNLTLWEPPATGIKLLNGINHTRGTWQGNMLRHDTSAEAIALNISNVINGEQIRECPLQAKVLAPVPLPDGYKLLNEHGEAVLAQKNDVGGEQQYVIWHIDADRNGVWGGTYISNDLDAAARCFALKSGMVNENTVFDNDELTEIYKCLQDTTYGQYTLNPADKTKIVKIGCKIEQAIPDIQKLIFTQTVTTQDVQNNDFEIEI